MIKCVVMCTGYKKDTEVGAKKGGSGIPERQYPVGGMDKYSSVSSPRQKISFPEKRQKTLENLCRIWYYSGKE